MGLGPSSLISLTPLIGTGVAVHEWPDWLPGVFIVSNDELVWDQFCPTSFTEYGLRSRLMMPPEHVHLIPPGRRTCPGSTSPALVARWQRMACCVICFAVMMNGR